jgi:hypothetical protein
LQNQTRQGDLQYAPVPQDSNAERTSLARSF